MNRKKAESIQEKLSRDNWQADPPMLTLPEAAWYMNMRKSRLQRLIECGDGPQAVWLDEQWLISMNAISVFMSESGRS